MHRIPLQLSFTLLTVLLFISACGQKGPLYMPDKEQTDKTAEAPSS
ncbi:MAG: lipoprotein [Candidatus Thiodiazotropha sp.]